MDRAYRTWRVLPEDFGKWFTVWKRFRRRAVNEVFEKVFKAFSGEPVRGAKVMAVRALELWRG
jgi:transposase